MIKTIESTPTTLTQEELDKVREVQFNYQQLVYRLGELNLIKSNILQSLEDTKSEISIILENLNHLTDEDNELSKSLQDKYGSTRIDLETGTLLQ